MLRYSFIFYIIIYIIRFSSTQVEFSLNDINQSLNNINRELTVIFNTSMEYSFSVPKKIANDGYKVEEHKVETEDGYILTMHRIPCGKICNNITKIPILCVHGLFASSSSFVLRESNNSLGYILADVGYDVWLGNTRGSLYSRSHIDLDEESFKFWQFSFHEKGVFDVSAMINYILKLTGHSELAYIGHSEGTTNLFVLLSVRPEYNKKISISFMLSPVVYLKHSRIPLIGLLSRGINFVNFLSDVLGDGPYYTFPKILLEYQKFICNHINDSPLNNLICIFPFALFIGYQLENFDYKSFNFYLSHAEGNSIKELNHYAQLQQTGEFQWYDYTIDENLAKYKSHKPPFYDLCKVIVPTILFYSPNDLIVSYTDVNKLNQNLHKSTLIITKDWTISHIDFLLGRTASEEIYDTILDILKLNFKKFPAKNPVRCNGSGIKWEESLSKKEKIEAVTLLIILNLLLYSISQVLCFIRLCF